MIASNSKYLFVLLVFLFSCHRIRKKTSQTWKNVKSEMTDQKNKLLNKGFNAVFGDVSTRKTTFDEQFGNHPGFNVEQIEGIWIDLPAGYYYCFLKYKANKEKVFRFIESQPTKNESISSKEFREATNKRIKSNLELLEKDYPDAYKQISFFYGLTEREDILYYECSRYPKSHILVIDQKNGMIYHHFERYAD